VLTVVMAIPLGLLSECSQRVQAALEPFIEFYRPLPPLAYCTLLVIWLGIEDPSKIALLYLAGFAPLYIAAVAGVNRIPRDRINAARSLGASSWQVFRSIVFPSCPICLLVCHRCRLDVYHARGRRDCGSSLRVGVEGA
jgi:taurine transport system permease protein